MDSRALLVPLVVVLAGCSGLFPGADTPSATAETEGIGGSFTPPGVTSEGVIAPGLLAETHAEFLSGTSYTLTSNRTVRYGNGSLRSKLSLRVRLAANRSYFAIVRTGGKHGPVLLGRPPASAEFWGNGWTYVRALTRGNETVYNSFRPPTAYVGTWRYWVQTVAFGGRGNYAERRIATIFDAIPTRLTGRSRRNGTRVYSLVGTRAASTAFALSDVDTVHSVRLDASVTSAGLVRSVRLRYVATIDGERITVRRQFEYSRIGSTTAGRPEWFDRAVDDDPTATPTQNRSTATPTRDRSAVTDTVARVAG